MTYRLAIFDFDGTLADSAGWFVGALPVLARRHGFRAVSDAEIAHLRGLGTREVMRALRVSPWRLPAIARDARRMMAAEADGIRLFDGAVEAMAGMKAAGCAVAVVSSNAEETIRRVLGPDGAAAVDAFNCGAGLFGKPAKFRALMKRFGVAAAETLCVGDETRDVEAAKAVGAESAAVTWGYATREALAACGPTFLVDAPGELAGLAGGR